MVVVAVVGSLDAHREGCREGCEVREMLLRLCVNRARMGGDSRGEAGTERSAQQQQQQQPAASGGGGGTTHHCVNRLLSTREDESRLQRPNTRPEPNSRASLNAPPKKYAPHSPVSARLLSLPPTLSSYRRILLFLQP